MTTMPVTRWRDHILGPDTTAARPAASLVPEHALYADTDDGVLYINAGGTWTIYRSPGTGLSDPTTTKGDLLARSATAVARFAVGTDGQVLTADSTQTLGVKWATPSSGGTTTRTINAQTGTSYTLVLGDAGAFVTMTNAAASILTVPPNSSVAYPVGTFISGAQLGAGQVTLTPGAGVTITGTPGLKIAGQYGTFEILKTATDTWLAYGRLSA